MTTTPTDQETAVSRVIEDLAMLRRSLERLPRMAQKDEALMHLVVLERTIARGADSAPSPQLLERALSAMREVQERAEPGFAPDVASIPAEDWRAFVDAHAEVQMLWAAWRDAPGCTYPDCSCEPNGDVGCNSPNAAAQDRASLPVADSQDDTAMTALKEFREIGSRLANMAFNMAQRGEGYELSAEECAGFKQLQREWDAAISVAARHSADTDRPRSDEKESDVSLSELHELAKVYASGYASPHHMVFSVQDLQEMFAKLRERLKEAP